LSCQFVRYCPRFFFGEIYGQITKVCCWAFHVSVPDHPAAPSTSSDEEAGKVWLVSHFAAPSEILPAAAEQSHQIDSGALLAPILNDVAAFRVGRAFLNLHCLFAHNATQQIYQRAFIVIQMRIVWHPSHFQPFTTSPWP
jgi:hypothetical protein